jgi:hypothetical protein
MMPFFSGDDGKFRIENGMGVEFFMAALTLPVKHFAGSG